MVNYTSQTQLDIFNFRTDFESKLDPNNRWVKLAKLLDWDAFAAIYAKKLNSHMGAKGVDARVVIGALIIKHIEGKDDRGTIAMIQENAYMQFFLGFDHFHYEPIFDASLFVHIRKRLGLIDFDKMNQIIIEKALNTSNLADILTENKVFKNEEIESENTEESSTTAPEKPTNHGKLQLDATVCDAYITYPTDLGLLNDSREKSEQIIDILCAALDLEKPRTYRRKARKLWVNLSKSKGKTKKKIRKGISEQLGFLRRNLGHINNIIDQNPAVLSLLDKKTYKYLLVINTLYDQQLEMHKERKNSIPHRIVSIHQPHVRPIVRGKSGNKKVEFGAKINVSLEQGYARIDQFNFEAFNEGICLKAQVERYKNLHGYYPELLQVDQIYLNRDNRKFMKDNKIRHTGIALGRKPKQEIPKQEKAKKRQEKNERNHIEGKFGQGKTKYGLNNIKAKLTATSQSWIAAIILVMNILKLAKDFSLAFFYELFFRLFFEENNAKMSVIKLE